MPTLLISDLYLNETDATSLANFNFEHSLTPNYTIPTDDKWYHTCMQQIQSVMRKSNPIYNSYHLIILSIKQLFNNV